MHRETTIRITARMLFGLVVLAVFATAGAAQDQTDTEARQMAATRRAELAEAGRLLADPEAEGHRGAVHMLVHIASSYSVLPEEVRILLIRATGDPDPAVAGFAMRALFNIEHRKETPDAELPEQVRIELSRRRGFEHAKAILGDSSSGPGERFGAMRTLVHLASVAPALSDEVVLLLENFRSDGDPDVAHLAENALAKWAVSAVH